MANDPHSSTNFTVLRADTYLNLPSLGGGGGGEGTEETTGQTFYVCNSTTLPPGGVAGADNANVGKSPLTPFATLDYAIGQTSCPTMRSQPLPSSPSIWPGLILSGRAKGPQSRE